MPVNDLREYLERVESLGELRVVDSGPVMET